MPGIYVRKANWIDWTQREENPNLTVPGSYWLCHKNDIYKFIFRYHRSNRNVTEFGFGKELMKVIRRIIKNPPAQGQQFSTSHLLITFNLTWWNKQDKLFALLKFDERSLNTFSHAFILTIKLNSPSDSGQNLKCPPIDHSFHYRDRDEESVCTNKDTNKLDNNLNVSFETPATSENNVSLNDEINDSGSLVGETSYSEDGNVGSSSKRDRAMDDEEKSNQQDAKEDANQQLIGSNASRTLNDDNNVDSANLPYQYLIEKEIETTGQNVRKRKLGAEDKTDTKNHAESQPDRQLQDLPHSKKRKYELDNSQRSSDITDLVMEGLMFTIRQGQDTVAVIEQKTELEMDEVLENSEKIETEEGEKRLRNSSLLGMENLITMIESPNGNKFESKRRSVIAQCYPWMNRSLDNKVNECSGTADLKHAQQQTADDSALVGTSSGYAEPREYVTPMGEEKGEREEGKQQVEREQREARLEETETAAEEDEDIIPEALQNDDLQPYLLQPTPRHDHTNRKNLSTDEMNESMNKQLESVNRPNSSNKRRSKINSPIIISNRLITVNEIPSPLRKILKDRLTMEDVPSDNQNEMNKANTIDIQEEQPRGEEDKICTVQFETDVSNTPRTDRTIVNDDKDAEENDESKLSATLEPEATVSNTTEENVKLNEEESEEANKGECLYSGELKNITEDFHKSMEYSQKRRKIIEKSLRPRRKSLHLQNATNDCEMHVQMSKFFEDITRGAKVLVKRIDLNKCL
ncbi:uncharacterized protein LOC108631052 [Ceratina calcarata]|uniref:Uncharacterized protein LOC108631052 n=1 Tax=Ceratina calcarata TaxID=156304 RepID=A0AAJ7JDM9_9HYME|nr:uncharacterized protein LOC108631052 [Ceratina calcarata]XP_017890232.1 uncharacterized protein LOC108631052 [Ceratina calcarata]XP_017890234.1 uncharacterized protein LOC108631052 [Ceratina calcarata]XP_026674383.1 uncharacterized protein LOC108631052 [Ceratina calcarata]XP_026674384.1 uncharacterized protein LOC108631052 [Ceratina calcarata]